MSTIRELLQRAYRVLIPRTTRQSLHRKMHAAEYRALRTAVFPSDKGTFSLRRCDELRAIFVHTPKAAGTSLALSIFGELPYHYTAEDYLAIFGRRTFADYFTFSVVRNPWDRVYSAYTYLSSGGWDAKDRLWSDRHLSAYTSFEDFVHHGLALPAIQDFMHFRPQHEFLCRHDGTIAVKYVGYFETLDVDFAVICRRMGTDATLSHANKSTEANYRIRYDATTREIVAGVYAKDIQLFGYNFEGIRSRVTPESEQ